jgi:enoyl-CoA hydratase/carnithine racemase
MIDPLHSSPADRAEAAAEFRRWVAALPRGPGRVRVETDPTGRVVEIVLDNPAKKNALTPHMMVELADAADALRSAHVAILRGEADAFCSGGDLDAVAAHLARPGGGRLLGSFMSAAVDALCAAGPPILGVLTGSALGGGAELLSACDVVIASPTARVGFVQARLGVSTGFGGGGHLVSRVGPSSALILLADASPVSAENMKNLHPGLVHELAEVPLVRARALADAWSALPRDALLGARRIVRGWTELPPAAARDQELGVFEALWGGPAHRAALAASRSGRA